jgi:hypothetical protein
VLSNCDAVSPESDGVLSRGSTDQPEDRGIHSEPCADRSAYRGLQTQGGRRVSAGSSVLSGCGEDWSGLRGDLSEGGEFSTGNGAVLS